MRTPLHGSVTEKIPILLRGEVAHLSAWLQARELNQAGIHLLIIVAGAGLFGAAIGIWRSPLQGLYTAIKLPLALILVTLCNALLNGMLALLLGANLSFRQSLMAILMSFTIAAAILGAFSPLMFFLVWNLPPLEPGIRLNTSTYSSILLLQTLAIAFAGVAANLRLLQLLRHLSGSSKLAWRVLLAWLAGNLLLGSQLTWILRPFVGSPSLAVQFLRDNAFESNFFEACLFSLRQLF